MRTSLTGRRGLAVGIAASALALGACGTDDNTTSSGSTPAPSSGSQCASGTIQASGSTAQANAIDEWKKGYQSKCSGASVNYQATGSGAGVQAFIQGTTSFAGSDSALKDDEVAPAAKRCATGAAIDIPMVVGPLAVAYNLSGVDSLTLTPAVVADIFAGKITKWNDAKIAALNSGVTLPATGIQAFHRSDSSGSTDNFTKYLEAAAPSNWTYGTGKEWKAPEGQGAKGSDGVTTSVKQTTGGVTYIEYSYAKNASLGVAKIDNGGGAVELTTGSAAKAVEAATITGTGNDLKLKVDYATKAAGAYPIVLVTYEITCEKGLPAEQLALVKGFLGYAASDEGQGALETLGYAPLPDMLQTKVQAAVAALS